MGDLLGVTVQELVGVLKKKHARLPFEIGAFVALETCEALLKGPARVSPSDVRVTEDGAVSVFAPPNSASGDEAARSVVAVLAHVLVAAGPGVPPVLLDLVEHGPSDGRWDLSRLRDELEASLVPLNRGAARRVLSRMLREARRDGAGRTAFPETEPDDVDAELDALIGVPGDEEDEPSPAPGGNGAGDAVAGPAADAHGGGGSAAAYEEVPFEEMATIERPAVPQPPAAPVVPVAPAASAAPAAPDLDDDFDDATAKARRGELPKGRRASPVPREREPEPDRRRTPWRAEVAPRARRSDVDVSGMEEMRPRRGKALLWAVIFLLLIGALVGGVAWLRPDAVDRFLGREAPEDRIAAELAEERARAQRELEEDHARRFGNLVVSVSPPRAQVLLFVGRGPAVAHQLPPGLAHEFIAIADGRVPTRAVVPPDAQWEETEEGPRYELAMQTGEAEMAADAFDLGATRLPREMGEPLPELGSVRIVTNPPGAKVYQLVGFAPSVRIESLNIERPHELLIWHEGHAPERVVVGPSDFRDAEGEHLAEIRVELTERD